MFRFKDGSRHDETAVFSERQQFRLVRDHLIQKGRSFPRPIDMTIDVARGRSLSGTAMTMGSRRSSPNR